MLRQISVVSRRFQPSLAAVELSLVAVEPSLPGPSKAKVQRLAAAEMVEPLGILMELRGVVLCWRVFEECSHIQQA